MTATTRDITVIGAGVIGVACARQLQRDGHRVCVLDPEPPGQACSWGNAGVFATDSVIPLATPATLRAVPAMLLRSDAPLTLRWRYLPRLLPWLLRFVTQARPRRVAEISRALTALCTAADDATAALVAESRAAELIHDTGWLTVYETRAGLEAGRAEAAERQRHGIECEVLSAAAVRQWLPAIGDHVTGGLRSPQCAMCADPGAFVAHLAADVATAGGTFERVRAHRLVPHADGIRIETDRGSHDSELVVVATGIETNALAATVGERFPLDTERGYHLMAPEAGVRPALPVMAGEHKFVTTPMAQGLRLAGLTELGGTRLPPDPRRYRSMLRHAQRLFPALAAAQWSQWMGFRSTLPDSLPVIGPSPREPRVHYAFGHQHLGLTLAGLTGQLIADGVAGRASAIDTAPLRPGRWLGG